MNIVSKIGAPATLEQTAEETVELAQALLKLAHACQKEARRLRGENFTPVSAESCKASIEEEMADVYVCIHQLNLAGYALNMDIVCDKMKRWEDRIEFHTSSKVANLTSEARFAYPETNYLTDCENASEGAK